MGVRVSRVWAGEEGGRAARGKKANFSIFLPKNGKFAHFWRVRGKKLRARPEMPWLAAHISVFRLLFFF
jgi:hypothetical protein